MTSRELKKAVKQYRKENIFCETCGNAISIDDVHFIKNGKHYCSVFCSIDLTDFKKSVNGKYRSIKISEVIKELRNDLALSK